LIQSNFHVKCFGTSDRGRRRTHNEDCYVCDPNQSIFLVADGMGGEKYGEVASRLTADTFIQLMTPFIVDEDTTLPFEHTGDGDYLLETLLHALHGTNQAVIDFVQAHPSHKGMGSTLTAVLCQSETIYVAHVGDSRLYRLRKEKLEQLTEDHSKVQEMVNKKVITPEEARNHPQKNVITQCIGRKKHLKPDCFIQSIEEDDLYLLCSDGLTDMLKDEDIRTILMQSEGLDTIGQTLIDAANRMGGKDNITVVLLQFVSSEHNF
jgi:serine/threonine protein phosphatase PrpC